MQRYQHDYVEYELGAEDQNDGTPARVENEKIKSKNAQDQFSTAWQLWGGGLIFPKELGGPSTVNLDAQRTPEVALQNGDVRYNLRDDKQKRRIARGDTNRTAGGGHGYRRHEDRTSPEDIGNDDIWTTTSEKSAYSKKSYSPKCFTMIIEYIENGKIIDFVHHFPTFQHQKDTDIIQVGSQLPRKWGGAMTLHHLKTT